MLGRIIHRPSLLNIQFDFSHGATLRQDKYTANSVNNEGALIGRLNTIPSNTKSVFMHWYE
jgi:hypothetical protein